MLFNSGGGGGGGGSYGSEHVIFELICVTTCHRLYKSILCRWLQFVDIIIAVAAVAAAASVAD